MSNIPSGFIRRIHHVGLPSNKADWEELKAFWVSLGLLCRIFEVNDPEYDHAGAGSRLQVFAGNQLLVSYYHKNMTFDIGLGSGPIQIVHDQSSQHLALQMEPPALDRVREHPAFERETDWGMGNTSAFLRGPYGLHIELVINAADEPYDYT